MAKNWQKGFKFLKGKTRQQQQWIDKQIDRQADKQINRQTDWFSFEKSFKNLFAPKSIQHNCSFVCLRETEGDGEKGKS